MIIDIIKHLIPTEITDKGGASIQLVNKKTIALSTTIKEAKEGLYTLGDAQFIQGTFEGLIKSMAKGVERDGHSRQLGDFLTLYAQPIGPIDIDKGWDESKNMMVLKARLLNRMVLNTRDWTFNDVTPGKDTFVIDNITTGEKGGGVTLGNRVHVNGRDFPAVDKLTVEWMVEGTDKHGVVPTSYMLGSCDRIDIAEGAFADLKSAEYDGKTLTLTVRGNFSKATKAAILKYTPEPVRINALAAMLNAEKTEVNLEAEGEHLKFLEGDEANYRVEVDGTTYTGNATVVETEDDFLALKIDSGVSAAWEGAPLTLTLKSRGGRAADPVQTTTAECEIQA